MGKKTREGRETEVQHSNQQGMLQRKNPFVKTKQVQFSTLIGKIGFQSN